MKYLLAFFWLFPTLAFAGGITGQNALYDLSLAKIRTHDITGATGQMSYNVVDGCTGWGTTQHMTLLIRNADGSLNKSITDYVTWETKDGKSMSFSLSEADNDGKVHVDDAGTATRTNPDGSGVITYSTPADTKFKLPAGTLFPTAHTEALLAAGRDGKNFISPLLFDGTSPNGAQATFAAIVKQHPPEANAFTPLSNLASTDVDIAFFDRKNEDVTPDFRTQMRYFEDGVATDIVLDFGDFTMTGKLLKLSIPPGLCKAKP